MLNKIIIQTLVAVLLIATPLLVNAQWTETSLSEGKSLITTGVIDDKVYFIGGDMPGFKKWSDLIEVYDTNDDSWSTIQMPFFSCCGDAITYDNFILVANSDQPSMALYDINNDTWTNIAYPHFVQGMAITNEKLVIHNPRSIIIIEQIGAEPEFKEYPFESFKEGKMTAAKGKVFIAGGNRSNEVKIFDIATETWSGAELSRARGQIEAVASENKVFFIGGETESFALVSEVDIYDVDTDTWTVENMSIPRYRLDATVHDNKLYIAGGQIFSFSSDQYRSDLDIFDIETNTWEKVEFPTGRRYPSIVGHKDKIYVAGGDSYLEDKIDLIEVYTISDTLSTEEEIVEEETEEEETEMEEEENNENSATVEIRTANDPWEFILFTSDDQNILKIEAVDVDGNTVYTRDMDENVASLNTNNFAKGKYNIIVTTTNGKMTEELVID